MAGPLGIPICSHPNFPASLRPGRDGRGAARRGHGGGLRALRSGMRGLERGKRPDCSGSAPRKNTPLW